MKLLHLNQLAAFSLLLSLGASSKAQNAPTPNPQSPTQTDPFKKSDVPPVTDSKQPVSNIMATYEIYEVDSDAEVKMLNGATDEERYDQTLALVREGKARMHALLSAVIKNAEACTVEQTDIFPYFVTFTLPKVANETKQRLLGDRLVCRPQLTPDGSQVEIMKILESTKLLCFQNRSVQRVEGESAETVSEPCFNAKTVVGNNLCSPGKIMFLGTFGRASQDTRTSIAFLRAFRLKMEPESISALASTMVESQFETYSLDREKARVLLSTQPEHESLYKAVQALVATKEAKLEHLNVLKGSKNIDAKFSESYELPTGSVRDASQVQELGWMGDVKLSVDSSFIVLDLIKFQLLQNLGPVQADGKPPELTEDVFEKQYISTRLYTKLGEHEFVGTITPPGETGVNGKKDSGQVWLQFVRTNPVNP